MTCRKLLRLITKAQIQNQDYVKIPRQNYHKIFKFPFHDRSKYVTMTSVDYTIPKLQNEKISCFKILYTTTTFPL